MRILENIAGQGLEMQVAQNPSDSCFRPGWVGCDRIFPAALTWLCQRQHLWHNQRKQCKKTGATLGRDGPALEPDPGRLVLPSWVFGGHFT